MKCPNCHAHIDASNAQFVDCTYCGTRVLNETVSGAGPEDRVSDVMKAVFKDNDNDGVPDIFQKIGDAAVTKTVHSTTITVNGKTYNSMDDVPEEIKNILGSLGPIQKNTVDKVTTTTHTEFELDRERTSTAMDISDTFVPQKPGPGLAVAIVAIVAIAIGLAGAAIGVYFALQ